MNPNDTSGQTWKVVQRSGQEPKPKKRIEEYKKSNKPINPRNAKSLELELSSLNSR